MICISVNKDRFFYDIHSLVKAFYPTEEVSCFVSGTKSTDKDAGPIALDITLSEERGTIAAVLFRKGDEDRRTGWICRTKCIPEKSKERISSIDTAPVTDERGERIYRAKNALKRLLYRMLAWETGRKLPWGSLTGIRPTHIPKVLLAAGRGEQEILGEMEETYFVSPEKAALALEIAGRERKILAERDYANGFSLYVGIPFCPTTCLYCSFPSNPAAAGDERMERYLRALFAELDFTAQLFRDRRLDTVYIGGGTPTTLAPEQMERLLSRIRERFDLRDLREFTVEAGRPDSITSEKLRVLREQGVTRLSINPQTMQQRTLDLIGRRHTVEDVISAFHLARESGAFSINMDLILGLPGENADDVADTLSRIAGLAPDDLTIHALAIKRGSRMQALMDTKGAVFPASPDIDAAAELAQKQARRMGLLPYYLYRQKNIAGNFENTGFAREGAEGLYNILINEDVQSIAACGAGSISKCVRGDVITRSENVKDLEQYLLRIEEMIERKKKLYEEGKAE
ncbi:MAG: coproporphyrinogen dehydrogenase HemZ [Lachnospiraceae bacterium]|nr:coproporphyrinogen dehydrogenase HemZ [Lachnospiraceae bacterium]